MVMIMINRSLNGKLINVISVIELKNCWIFLKDCKLFIKELFFVGLLVKFIDSIFFIIFVESVIFSWFVVSFIKYCWSMCNRKFVVRIKSMLIVSVYKVFSVVFGIILLYIFIIKRGRVMESRLIKIEVISIFLYSFFVDLIDDYN